MDSQDQDLGHDSSTRDRPEDITTYDSGIGRSYECVFCKRGFATAQALGGHMNIHRKDRANPKLNPCASSSINHEPGFPSDRRLSSQVDFHQFLTPPNMPSSSNPRFPMDASQNVLLSICCKEKRCSSSLGLHIGVASSDVVGEIRKRKSSQVGLNIHQQAVEEVDLELRLGHLKP